MKTTVEAFTELTNQRNWGEALGINGNTARATKKYFKAGTLRTEKMEEILQAAGYKVVQEKIWSKEVETSIKTLGDLTKGLSDLSRMASNFGIEVKVFMEKLEKTS